MLYSILDKLTISLLMAALDNNTAAFLLFVTLSVIKVIIVIVCQRLWKILASLLLSSWSEHYIVFDMYQADSEEDLRFASFTAHCFPG
jgi:hypothetical protein